MKKRYLKPPVWEANHVWLILVIVIIFMGFPRVYTVLSTALHIPLFIMLLGIIFRGTAFTFRYYDVDKDHTHNYYTHIFRINSILTPFFLGVTLGAMILGRISTDYEEGFVKIYIDPWANAFSFVLGIFTVLLFGYISSAFLSSETSLTKEERYIYATYCKRFLIALLVAGPIFFFTAEFYEHQFVNDFFHSFLSVGCIALATALIPIVWVSLNRQKALLTRLITGIQVCAIIGGWLAIQFPVIVIIQDTEDLTFYNTMANPATIKALIWALGVGILLIFPSLFYLFKVFKSD
ncbi:cytochrome d ubiquinol oxidase subunit II [Catalinimonas niigatensis]|uniref:cytochrome d ubiquinol oxidase subunit II n=1 Tax=Catalinimonas niigatensis TaxID=1397264 RepID=UPI002665BE9F|nr:cytochrome d ubiquinol oxidase subunit II [Catalinimonas niigatensis]WPP50798.1 cytochrome d ubiquinol oxidase subunit II [Catalinimonas niigatensis]